MDNHTNLVMVIDCVDADALAGFWSSALGFRRGRFHSPYVRLVDPAKRGPVLLLQQVLEPKSGRNGMHLDIQVAEMDPELQRLGALGATIVSAPHDDSGFLTAILRPAGQRVLCVIMPPAGYDPYYERVP